MSELVYVKGDATNPIMKDFENVIIAHVCNNHGAWGKGFSYAVSAKWPDPENEYRQAFVKIVPGNKTVLGQVQTLPVTDSEGRFSNTYIANMIAQDGFASAEKPKALVYSKLVDCMEQIALQAESMGSSIHCPKFGAGLAGGDWKIIEALIQEIWVDAGIDVTVYEYEG